MKGFDVKVQKTPSMSPVYFFGFIGAVVYYLQKADAPKQKIFAVLKAFAWPAWVVYEILKSMPRQ